MSDFFFHLEASAASARFHLGGEPFNLIQFVEFFRSIVQVQWSENLGEHGGHSIESIHVCPIQQSHFMVKS